jgi:hypothetical protein
VAGTLGGRGARRISFSQGIDESSRCDSPFAAWPMTDLFVFRGVSHHIRSDNGSEFTARAVCQWLGQLAEVAHGRSLNHAGAKRVTTPHSERVSERGYLSILYRRVRK